MNKSDKPRTVALDALKILSMLMICIVHILGHGGILNAYQPFEAGDGLFWLLEAFGMVSVNCFVLITGYFLCEKIEYSFYKIKKVVAQVLFYSLLCYAIVVVGFGHPTEITDTIYVFLPLTTNQYWFMTSYAVLVLLSPLLNKAIAFMTKRELQRAIMVLITLFCIIPSLLPWSREVLGIGYDFEWFIVLYFCAAYMRIYGLNLSIRRSSIIYCLSCVMCFISRAVLIVVTKTFFGRTLHENLFYYYNSIFVLVGSIMLFNVFRQMSVSKGANAIVQISGCSIGAYLLTDNPYIREYLWKTISLPERSESLIGRLCMILLFATMMLVVGSSIEAIRKKCLEMISRQKP